jgi:hypothetical protein
MQYNNSHPYFQLIPDNIPAENLSCVQQFSFENLVKEMIRPTPSSKTPTNSSIMPSLERDVTLTEGIGMERIDTECIDLSRSIISHEKISKSNNNNETEKVILLFYITKKYIFIFRRH